jgi:hypothetical protein
MEQEFRESVIRHLENLKTTTEGIISTGWIADIWGRGFFIVSLEQHSDITQARDELLNLCNSIKLVLI